MNNLLYWNTLLDTHTVNKELSEVKLVWKKLFNSDWYFNIFLQQSSTTQYSSIGRKDCDLDEDMQNLMQDYDITTILNKSSFSLSVEMIWSRTHGLV